MVCVQAIHMSNMKALSQSVETELKFLKNIIKVGQRSKSRSPGINCWYVWKGLVSSNRYVKYESPKSKGRKRIQIKEINESLAKINDTLFASKYETSNKLYKTFLNSLEKSKNTPQIAVFIHYFGVFRNIHLFNSKQIRVLYNLSVLRSNIHWILKVKFVLIALFVSISQ